MSEARSFDIAIIGGGLAGLALAIQSAYAGYKTILFEKESYPFHKVCGEYISFESWQFLEQLGVRLTEWKLPVIKKLNISDCYGNLHDFDLPLGGFGISRYKLDDELYNVALKKGVTVMTQTKVTDVTFTSNQFDIKSSRGNFNSIIAAACYGKRSNIDVKLDRPFIKQKANKLNNYIGIKYHVKFPHPPNTIALHNFENGYCGMSQIENDHSCLCYLTTASNLEQNGNSIEKMEAATLFKNPFLKNIFSNAEFLFKHPVAISQVSFAKKRQVEDNILMIGDAAGLITPLCGNGMSMALHGSKLAFEAIHLFLQNKVDRNSMEKLYIGKWQKQFSKRLFTGRLVQKLFAGNLSTSLFLKALDRLPFVADKVIASTHGKPF